MSKILDNIRNNINKTTEKIRKLSLVGGDKKTILFAPLDSHGHINSLVCLANHLHSLGHRTVFLFIEPIVNSLAKCGHEVYDSTTGELVLSEPNSQAQDKWDAIIKQCHDCWSKGDVFENIKNEMRFGFGVMIEDIKKYNDNIDAKIELIKPDLIIVDHYFGVPAIFKYIANNEPFVKWVRIFSANPLSLYPDDLLPAPYLGLQLNLSKLSEEELDKVTKTRAMLKQVRADYNAYWQTFNNLAPLPESPATCIPESKYLNLYMCPAELDYDIELKNWTRCDSLIRAPNVKRFVLPKELRNKPGKVIFLSMGSLVSANVILMKRLTEILADSPNKFIVAKGPCANEYQLADNMWGESFVDQLSVLRSIDLIITHGGNNTITESFYFGVPGFIVLPLFADQFDNAQRIKELKLGERFDPFNCSKDELLSAVERILGDEEIKKRMKLTSKRMQQTNCRNKPLVEVTNLLKSLPKKDLNDSKSISNGSSTTKSLNLNQDKDKVKDNVENNKSSELKE